MLAAGSFSSGTSTFHQLLADVSQPASSAQAARSHRHASTSATSGAWIALTVDCATCLHAQWLHLLFAKSVFSALRSAAHPCQVSELMTAPHELSSRHQPHYTCLWYCARRQAGRQAAASLDPSPMSLLLAGCVQPRATSGCDGDRRCGPAHDDDWREAAGGFLLHGLVREVVRAELACYIFLAAYSA